MKQLRTFALFVLVSIAGLLATLHPYNVALWFLLLLAVLSTTQASMEYRWRNYTSRNPVAAESIRFPAPRDDAEEDLTSFAFIVPGLHEADVIAATLEQLAAQNYPTTKFEVLVTLREEDDETLAEAHRVAQQYPGLIRVFAHRFAASANKSTQMNRVLPHVTAEYVTPMDAESIVATDLLQHVHALIMESGADVVQGAVQLTNLDTSHDGSWFARLCQYIASGWFAVHNVIEYRVWFSARMFFQQDQGVVPLGGNTVFARTDLIRESGGWDEKCLAEDCDKGIQLSVEYGSEIVAAYTAELATQEHTPPRMFGRGSWFRQRVRWDQGFLQVLKKGGWRKLLTFRKRLMALYILTTPFSQAVSGILMPLAILAAFFLKAPLGLTMLLFVPFIPLMLTLLTQLLTLQGFSRDFAVKAKLRHYLSLVVGFFPYQFLLGVAALVAVTREQAGIRTWSKTSRNASMHGYRPVLATAE